MYLILITISEQPVSLPEYELFIPLLLVRAIYVTLYKAI